MPAAAASAPSPKKRAPLSSGDFIGKWMSIIAPAADMLEDPGEEPSPDYITRLELAAGIDQSLANPRDDLRLGAPARGGRRDASARRLFRHRHRPPSWCATRPTACSKPLVEHLPERVSLFGAG